MITRKTISSAAYLYNDPNTPFLVDDLIALLEPHKGKLFINTAAEDTSFKIVNNLVLCDQYKSWLESDDLSDDEYDYVSNV